MVRNAKKLELATYYRKRGFSYSEIAKIVGVSKGTLSAWFAKKRFSKEVAQVNMAKANKENVKRISLLNKSRQKEREKIYKAAVKQAEVEYKHYKSNSLFIAGLMLYVGEGDNKHRRLIRIANARMDIHSIFIRFAIDFLGVDKSSVRFWLLLYPDLVEKDCVVAWNKVLKLKTEQFYKHQVIEGKSNKRTLQYGIGNTIISNTVLKLKLNRWIELAIKEIASSKSG